MSPGRPADDYDLETFRARSDRFLFARQHHPAADTGDVVDPSGLVYLEQGAAAARRQFTRDQLRCPEPDCTAPEITTVSRAPGGARDGYRHLIRPAVAHAPEGMLHRQSKALVARWASGHPQVAEVAVEAPVGGGDRIADVLLTSHQGRRIAVEIQYASLSIEDWQTRTTSYKAHQVSVVWLYGHAGRQSPLADRVRRLHRVAAGQGRPLLWLNPADESISWAVSRDTLPTGPAPIGPDDRGHDYRFGSLDDLHLRASGFYPPGWPEALRSRAEEDARLEAERQAARAERRRRRFADEARNAKRIYSTVPTSGADPASPTAPPEAPAAGRREQGTARDPRGWCTVCGGPLDPVLVASGRHVGDCARLY